MTKQSLRCRLSTLLANDVIFADKQHHNDMIERRNHELNQSLTNTMDFHYAEIVTNQLLMYRFSTFLTNDVLFTGKEHYITRIESGNHKLK